MRPKRTRQQSNDSAGAQSDGAVVTLCRLVAGVVLGALSAWLWERVRSRTQVVQPSPEQAQQQPAGGSQPQAEAFVDEQRHEKTDVHLKPIGALLIILVIGAFVVHASMLWWLRGMNRSPAPDEATEWRTRARALAQTSSEFPRLQISPQADWQSYLAQQQQRLNSYGWISPTTGVVRIPIAEAMEMIARGGAPEWPSTNRPASPLSLQHQRAEQSK